MWKRRRWWWWIVTGFFAVARCDSPPPDPDVLPPTVQTPEDGRLLFKIEQEEGIITVTVEEDP